MLQVTLLGALFPQLSLRAARTCSKGFRGHAARTRLAFTACVLRRMATETKRLGLNLMKWNGLAGTHLPSPALRASSWDSHCLRTYSGFRVGRRPSPPAPEQHRSITEHLLYREQRARLVSPSYRVAYRELNRS